MNCLKLFNFVPAKRPSEMSLYNELWNQSITSLSLHPRIKVWFFSTTSLLPFLSESSFSEIASETSPSIIANISIPPKLMETETNLQPTPSESEWLPESAIYVQDNQRHSIKLPSVTPKSAKPPRHISNRVATSNANGLAYGWTDKKASTRYASCLLRETSSEMLSNDLDLEM